MPKKFPASWTLDKDSGLTVDYLRHSLRYEPETGLFYWINPNPFWQQGRAHIGKVAGCLHKSTGYWQIKLMGMRFSAHRLAWLYMTGEWPAEEVDHENGVLSDNRWENLRAASRSQNMANTRGGRGSKCVYPLRDTGKWIARICVNYKQQHIGVYETKDEAQAAYVKVAQEKFGEFARV